MTVSIQKWKEPEQLKKRLLQERYPAPKYRVSSEVCEPNTGFSGSSESGLVFVLAGSCLYSFGALEFKLSAGEFVELPTGSFRFKTIGKETAELVHVWDIEKIASGRVLSGAP